MRVLRSKECIEVWWLFLHGGFAFGRFEDDLQHFVQSSSILHRISVTYNVLECCICPYYCRVAQLSLYSYLTSFGIGGRWC